MVQEATDWHTIDATDTLRRLESGSDGLSSSTAQQRLAEHGPNIIEEKQRRPLTRIVLGQFSDFMIMVLLLSLIHISEPTRPTT